LEKRRVRPWTGVPAVVLSLAVLTPSLPAAGLPAGPSDLRLRAQECESRGQWTEACACYDEILKSDHHDAEARERFQVCLRHANQLRRHRDPSFLKTIAGRNLPEALDAYEEVLSRLLATYVERDQVRLETLFRRGLEELRFAFRDDAFLRENLAGVPPDKVGAFARRLEQWPVGDVDQVRQAREQVRAVALAGADALGLNPTAVVMEFAWGAGNALDDYTVLLTPSQYAFLQATLRGEIVGVGVKVEVADRKVIVSSVAPGSPAAEKGLKANDQLARIDGQATDGWSEEVAAARLQGRIGSAVELDVVAGEAGPRHVRLVRQPLLLPSVEWEPMPRDGVGYVRLLSFQDSTPQELKDAVLQLQALQMKALILDLRGNSGGVFLSAVEVAKMFLSEGVIVSTESPVKRFHTTTYRAHNPSALTLPLVVLVDGDTASAAEVLAGALKENGRATLVGAPTYGKGSIQCPVGLQKIPAGIWITVAKFYSPTNQPYNGRGVSPHILEDVDVMGAQRGAAWRAAQQLLMMPR
jgi:carboxyl-terminal processing protease